MCSSAGARRCGIKGKDGEKVGGSADELIARIQKAAWDEALAEVRQING